MANSTIEQQKFKGHIIIDRRLILKVDFNFQVSRKFTFWSSCLNFLFLGFAYCSFLIVNGRPETLKAKKNLDRESFKKNSWKIEEKLKFAVSCFPAL